MNLKYIQIKRKDKTMEDMIRITTDLPKELVEFVQKHKKDTGISKARIYTEALKLFKEKVEKGN